MKKVGLIDSGAGGKAMLESLKVKYPNIDFTLLTDEKYFPYGNKSKDLLLERVSYLSSELINNGCDVILLACNTISTLYLDKNSINNVILINVISPLVDYINNTLKDVKNACLLATNNTVNSKVYNDNLNCNVFSIKAEVAISKIQDDTFIEEDAIRLIREVEELNKNIDLIILGCTHFIKVKEYFVKNTDIVVISQDELNYF